MNPSHFILFVDDDDEDVDMVTTALREMNHTFEVERAVNGEVAIEKLENLQKEQRLPCVIVLDLSMPKMDGKRFYEFVTGNSTFKNIPLIVLTSSSNYRDREYFESKAPFANKPFSLETLYKVANEIVDCCVTHR